MTWSSVSLRWILFLAVFCSPTFLPRRGTALNSSIKPFILLGAASLRERWGPPVPQALATLYPVYVRGEAYLKAGQGEKAANEYQKVIDHRSMVQNFVLGALAPLQLGRAKVIERGQGRRAQGLSRFPHPLERRRPRHPHPEASQGGVREAAVSGRTLSGWRFCYNSKAAGGEFPPPLFWFLRGGPGGGVVSGGFFFFFLPASKGVEFFFNLPIPLHVYRDRPEELIAPAEPSIGYRPTNDRRI